MIRSSAPSWTFSERARRLFSVGDWNAIARDAARTGAWWWINNYLTLRFNGPFMQARGYAKGGNTPLFKTGNSLQQLLDRVHADATATSKKGVQFRITGPLSNIAFHADAVRAFKHLSDTEKTAVSREIRAAMLASIRGATKSRTARGPNAGALRAKLTAQQRADYAASKRGVVRVRRANFLGQRRLVGTRQRRFDRFFGPIS